MQKPWVCAYSVCGIPTFKFQSRRDSVDWRRFSAIDVERVARELDVTMLQENITSVTFCNLDSEKCPHCQQPVDPVLLKVLKMAQLTIEYLLHSQEYLTASLALQEEQLQATLEELKRTKQELDKQAEEMKGVKEESRRRKKMIGTQQLLLQAGTNNYHKCQLCDKAFMNYSYLQAHVQRRHIEASEAGEYGDELFSFGVFLEGLCFRLSSSLEFMFPWQEAGKVLQREEEGRREFERWKEEERTKFQEEMDGLRQLFLTEFKDIASKNSALEGKLQELQAKNLVASNLGVLRDDDSDDKRQWALTQREVQSMREKIELQKTEWKKKLKELQKEHHVEKEELKSENERLRASLSQDQRIAADHFQQQMGSLNSRLKEQTKVIRSQEKTVSLPCSCGPVNTAWLSVPLQRKQRLLEALRRNPNLLKQFRPILEETLEEKLESMGVKRVAKGIPAQTYKNLSSLVMTQQQQKAKKFPNLLSLRDKLVREVTWKVKQRQKDDAFALSVPCTFPAKSQKSPLSPRRVASAKPRVLQVELQPYAEETPKPAPRSKASYSHSPTEVPRVICSEPSSSSMSDVSFFHHFTFSTPPFSSEEDSGRDRASLTPVKFKHPITLQKVQTPLRLTQNDETASDWSDIDSSEGKASPNPKCTSAKAPEKNISHHAFPNTRPRDAKIMGVRSKTLF
uniref:DAZ interacting zinc finger protein 1 like n=1 Tax=Chelydra serpentina TaxID=8475 RepID=A0A8C3T5T4_CHESE